MKPREEVVLYNPQVAEPGYHRLPLSLLHLAASLEGRFRYHIVDGNLLRDGAALESILSWAEGDGARYLAITLMPGPQLQQIIPELEVIRRQAPRLTVIVGGYFPSLYPDVCAGHGAVDYVVVGPGEETLRELLDALQEGLDPARVPGLVFRRDEGLVRTAPRLAQHPDTLPDLPYHAVDVESYVSRTHLGRRTLSHCSSFGCPFRCNFCGVAAMSGGRWLQQSPRRIADVVERLAREWRVDAFELHDNNFFCREEAVVELCEELLRRELDLGWWAQGRIDTMVGFAPQTWELLRRSGLRMVYMGAESSDEAVLRSMDKGGTLSPDSTLEMASLGRRYGIVPELSFLVGNPPDPEDDTRRTLRFIRRVKAVNPDAEIILYRYDPVPGDGALLELAESSGLRFPTRLEDWQDSFWVDVHQRRFAPVPWFPLRAARLVDDFETVLNAYHPTTTDPRLAWGPLRWILRTAAAWRYWSHLYRWPVELRLLQRLLRYRRPETSGF